MTAADSILLLIPLARARSRRRGRCPTDRTRTRIGRSSSRRRLRRSPSPLGFARLDCGRRPATSSRRRGVAIARARSALGFSSASTPSRSGSIAAHASCSGRSASSPSFTAITGAAEGYYAWMLVLLAAMLGVFLARDLLLFYVFFELTLVPMFFIIGIWGGHQPRQAAAPSSSSSPSPAPLHARRPVYLAWQVRRARDGVWTFDIRRPASTPRRPMTAQRAGLGAASASSPASR